MHKTILITRPNHDFTTQYLYYWSEPIEEKYCASLLWSNIKSQIILGNPDTQI